jgi:hypothetical protein
MPDESDALKNLRFSIEVSARYHDYRRATLGFRVTFVRFVSLLGSVLSLLAVSNWVESQQLTVLWVALIGIVVGIVNLVDLVFHFDSSAREHTSLFQRFKALQAKMARHQTDWRVCTPEWEAEAQEIRSDEPPTYWATYARAWNQTAEKYNENSHKRPLKFWQIVVGDWFHMRPDQFKTA